MLAQKMLLLSELSLLPYSHIFKRGKKIRLWKTAHGTFLFAHLHMCDIRRWCQEANMARYSFCRGQLSSWGIGVGDFAISSSMFLENFVFRFCVLKELLKKALNFFQ